MLLRLSEALTNAGIPMHRVEGVAGAPLLVFQAVATQPQRDAAAAIAAGFDWSQAAHDAWLAVKIKAVDAIFIDNPLTGINRVLRALVLALIDEINTLRQRDRDRATDVAAAGTFAAFKTSWAARSALSDRTATQARTAITGKINAGTADQ